MLEAISQDCSIQNKSKTLRILDWQPLVEVNGQLCDLRALVHACQSQVPAERLAMSPTNRRKLSAWDKGNITFSFVSNLLEARCGLIPNET